MNNILKWLFFVGFTALLFSCGQKKRVVAVSQCSTAVWREQMNEEMKREAFLHPDLEVEFHISADNTKEQIKDIESFIDRKVDLIVVAPHEEEALRHVIEKAYGSGIPVVLVDMRANTGKYTAYVGGDNVDAGRQAANYIISQLPHGGNIVEVEGLMNASSNKQRRLGFHEVIDKHPEIHVVGRGRGDWQRAKAEAMMDTMVQRLGNTPVDMVFGYNDVMAIGAHDAFMNHRSQIPQMPKFIGVDALMNDSIGIGRILDGTLDASFLYPTCGDNAIKLAADILEGKPYQREQIIHSGMVNKTNVHLMRLQAQHIASQNEKMEFLNQKLSDYFKQYSAQRILIIVFIVFIVVVCVLLFVSVRAYVMKHQFNVKLARQNDILHQQRDELANQKEIVEQQRDLLENEKDKLMEAKIQLEDQMKHRDLSRKSHQENEEEDGTNVGVDASFKKKLIAVIEKRIDDTEMTVDSIGAEVNLGRAQLYRKCKASTGMSPNELLRTLRLNKAYELLHGTDMAVGEVAYSVGFSSPSYFAKCYKDLYGENPTEAQQR